MDENPWAPLWLLFAAIWLNFTVVHGAGHYHGRRFARRRTSFAKVDNRYRGGVPGRGPNPTALHASFADILARR